MTTAAGSASEAAYAAALATLGGLGPRTLYRLLRAECPSAAWSRIVGGELEGAEQWRAQAERTDVAAAWEAHRRHRVGVLWVGERAYPPALADDPDAPGVLFHLGDPDALSPRPRVALVGTRSATRYGLGVAAQLGADLASAGVTIVSGLALGIDGAAHEGACAGHETAGFHGGPPVAVVAGGLDRPYPARHAGLWQRVEQSGVVLSTSPVRTPVDRWRFPQRNRIIAALSHVVVVVESHHAGGSLQTAHEAERRGLLVGAVPGSIRSPASAGTNDLLAEGCFPVRDVTDVHAALGLMLASAAPVCRTKEAVATAVGAAEAARVASAPAAGPGARRAGGEAPSGGQPSGGRAPRRGERSAAGPPRSEPARRVVDALGHDRCPIDQLLRRTGLDLPLLCTTLEELRAEGRLAEEGGWWERR